MTYFKVLFLLMYKTHLEVNTEKTKHTVAMSRHQTSEQNHHLLIVNKTFEKAVKFKYLGT